MADNLAIWHSMTRNGSETGSFLVATLYACFMMAFLSHVLPNWRMFTRKAARSHRFMGLAMLVWLVIGLVDALVLTCAETATGGL